jgi:hypothetical protein
VPWKGYLATAVVFQGLKMHCDAFTACVTGVESKRRESEPLLMFNRGHGEGFIEFYVSASQPPPLGCAGVLGGRFAWMSVGIGCNTSYVAQA